MSLVLNDRVRETTTIVGTGTATLLGAAAGYQSFSVIGNANTCYYTISDQAGTNWEVGIGTYVSATPALARTTVLSSSNAGALVSFPAGTKDVFVTYPSAKGVWLDASGNAIGLGTPAAFVGTNITGTAAAFNINGTVGATTPTTGAFTTVSTAGAVTITGTTSTDLPTYSAEFITTATWTSTGWTGDNTTGWVNGASNVSPLSYPTAAVVSTKYQIAYTVVRSAGSFTLAFGGQSTAGITATGAFGPTATTTGNLVITPTATFVGTIIVSIKSLTAVSTPVIVLKDSTNTVRFEARINTAASNTFLGLNSGSYNTTGVSNSAVGVSALLSNTTGVSNSAVGVSALLSNTTGVNNSAAGYQAGRFIADGATALTITNNSTYIGYNTRPLADNNTNETVIGYNAIGIGSNTTTIGNSSTLATKVFGVQATGQVAPTIASATTIAPTTSIVFVSGNISIATITPPTGIATTGGQITIIPKDTPTFSTTTAGNIALATTAVQNKALIMTYDATTLKWYPSY